MFMVIVALLLAAVIATLSYPFWRKAATHFLLGPAAEQDQERVDLELEREILLSSLAELHVECEREKLSTKDYEQFKASDERRLLQILDRLEFLNPSTPSPRHRPATAQPRTTLRWSSAVLVALIVVAGTSGVYGYLGWKQEQTLVAARQQMGQGMPDPREMVARLETRLRDDPNDLQGQLMVGRSYMALDRIDDATKAWAKVIELDPRNAEGNFQTGLILLTTRKIDDPKIFQQALSHFDIAFIQLPQEPALLWYRGIAQVHLQRYSEADESWTTAYQNLQPGSEDAEFVRTSLENLRAGKPPLF